MSDSLGSIGGQKGSNDFLVYHEDLTALEQAAKQNNLQIEKTPERGTLFFRVQLKSGKHSASSQQREAMLKGLENAAASSPSKLPKGQRAERWEAAKRMESNKRLISYLSTPSSSSPASPLSSTKPAAASKSSGSSTSKTPATRAEVPKREQTGQTAKKIDKWFEKPFTLLAAAFESSTQSSDIHLKMHPDDTEVLREALADVSQSPKHKASINEGHVVNDAAGVPYRKVSIKGIKKRWDTQAQARGNAFYQGETAQIKHALKIANKIGTSQLITLNQELEDIEEQLRELGKESPKANTLNARKAEILKEKPELAAKIESRTRLITTLDKATLHGRAYQTAKKVGAVCIIPFKAIGSFAIAVAKAAAKAAAHAAGAVAEEVQAAYSQKFYHVPKTVTFTVNKLKSELSAGGKQTLSFKDRYEKARNNLEVRGQDGQIDQAKTAELREKFDHHVKHHGDLLTLAIFNENTDAQTYLLNNGMFTVTKTMLKAVDNVSHQTTATRKKILTKLFTHAHNPEDLSTIVSHLHAKGEKEFAKELVSYGLEQWKEESLEKWSGDTNAAKFERCQLLATVFGDPKLFEQAFGIDPSTLYRKDGEPANVNLARREFLQKHRHVLEAQTKDGQNIMHHACLSDDPSTVQFLSEVMYIHNEQTIEDLCNTRSEFEEILKTSSPQGHVRTEQMIRSLDSRYVKVSGIQKTATMQMKNSVIDSLPSWMVSDSSMRALMAKHHKIREKLDKNPIDPGLLKQEQKLERQILLRLSSTIAALTNEKNPFAMRDKNFRKPKHLMSMKLANELDRLNNFNGNAQGSFSNMVGHRQFMQEELSRKETGFLAATTILGKWIGCIGPTHMLVNEPEMEMVKGFFAINGPLFTVGGAGFLVGAASIFGYRKYKAGKMGMDTSLSQSNASLEGLLSTKPVLPTAKASKAKHVKDPEIYKGISVQSQLKRAMKKRDLGAVQDLLTNDKPPYKIQVTSGMIKAFGKLHFFESSSQKTAILEMLCARCDQRKIYKLLDKELQKGDKQVVETIISEYIGDPELDEERYKGLLQVAAKLGNRDLLKRAIETAKVRFCDDDSQFLLKIIEPKSGDTLLHLAMATKDVSIITYVADEMIQASQAKNDEIRFERPRTGIFKKLLPKTKKEKLVVNKNIFEITNPKTGKRVFETPFFDKQIATQLDEAYGLLPDPGKRGVHSANGTFTQIYEMKQAEHRQVLTAEVLGVLPAKAILNLKAEAYIQGATLWAAKTTAHVMTGGASLVATTSLEFLTNCAVMAAGFGIGAFVGGVMGEQMFKLKMWIKGMDSSVTQLANEDIPADQILARHAHARRKVQRELRKEKFSKAETTVLSSAFKTMMDQIIEEANKNNDKLSSQTLSEMSKEIQEQLQPGKRKSIAQAAIARITSPLGPEISKNLMAAVGNQLKANTSQQLLAA